MSGSVNTSSGYASHQSEICCNLARSAAFSCSALETRSMSVHHTLTERPHPNLKRREALGRVVQFPQIRRDHRISHWRLPPRLEMDNLFRVARSKFFPTAASDSSRAKGAGYISSTIHHRQCFDRSIRRNSRCSLRASSLREESGVRIEDRSNAAIRCVFEIGFSSIWSHIPPGAHGASDVIEAELNELQRLMLLPAMVSRATYYQLALSRGPRRQAAHRGRGRRRSFSCFYRYQLAVGISANDKAT